MSEIPYNFYRYKQLPIFTEKTIPKWLLTSHNTKIGVYGKINVLEWKLKYFYLKNEAWEIEKEVFVEAGDYIVSEPQKWHKIEAMWETKIFIDFYEKKDEKITNLEKDFFKTFPEYAPHFEVYKLLEMIENKENKKALDLGSGLGRNSLLLAKAWLKVHSFDKNLEWLLQTKTKAQKNNLDLEIFQKDLNKDLISENYDVIISTVALQFLERDSATALLKSATEKTNIWWYNLIIVPILSDDLVCKIDFPNLRTYEEYLEFYKDWKIIYSDNMIWKFHRTDERWKKIPARFATIIARKNKN